MRNYKKILCAAVAAWAVITTGMLATKLAFDSGEDTYYLPAEVVATSESATYFGCENGHIYAVNDTEYSDLVPYLLCMDSCETANPTDDIVLVVWRTE